MVTTPSLDKKLSLYILDAFRERIDQSTLGEIRAFLLAHPTVNESIRRRAVESVLFRQPAALLAYFFVWKDRSEFLDLWPLTPDEARPFFIDLGISPPD